MNKNFIIKKVQNLMEINGTRKNKLGEVLGIKKSATTTAKNERAHRFLTGKQKSISIDEIDAISKFFERPVEYFLGLDDKSQSVDIKGENNGVVIRNNNGTIHVTSKEDKDLVKKILEAGKDDKDLLTTLLDKIQNKK